MLQRWIALTLIALTVAAADDFAPFSPVEGWDKQGLKAGGAGPDLADTFAWLKGQQREDGSWASPEGEHDVATTALVALAFLGEGHTHRFGEHKRTVNGALRYLRAREAPEGQLGWLDAALRCAALAEAYAVSRDFTLKPHVEGARDALLALRGEDGGWGNGPDAASNTLATTYGVLALKAVKTADVAVEDGAFEHARAVLEARTAEDGAAGFCAPGDASSLALGEVAPRVPLFTAGSAIARIFCGERRSTPSLRGASAILSEAGLGIDAPLYEFLASYAQFQCGGKAWDAWMPALEATLAGAAREDGSWKACGLVGALCGDAGTTAARTLALGIVSRYRRAMR